VAPKVPRTKSRRQLTWTRKIGYRLAVGLAKLFLEFLWWTCRIRVVGEQRLQALLVEHGAVVPACWHQHLLFCARLLVSRHAGGLKAGFMISPSVDGEAPSALARSYGARVVRGSGSYTGLRAVRGAHQAIKEGISPAITPDGPRGPRFKFKPGALFAAQISGKPVVPLAFAAHQPFILKTWDKFVIPKPFSRVCIAIGEPFYMPPDATDEQLQAAQREMEDRMKQTYQLARASLDGRKPTVTG
jgi:lysophospholipid acyltransferase (LPLAT)-like uncharacterized protein